MFRNRKLEDRMKPVLAMLWLTRLLAPKYQGIRDSNRGETVHVIEFRKCFRKNPFNGKETEDYQVTYLTKDGRMFTLPEILFYRFYGSKV